MAENRSFNKRKGGPGSVTPVAETDQAETPATKTLKQTAVTDGLAGPSGRAYPTVSQKTVDTAVASFIVEGMHPLVTVEQPAFKELMQGRCYTSYRIHNQLNVTKAFVFYITKNMII